jgi:hypothetical protein
VTEVTAESVRFLYDLTCHDSGKHYNRQEIFDSVFVLIDRAERYILLDMFLFNGHKGKSTRDFRPLSDELAGRLINKKVGNPDIIIDVITDPINTVYGGARSQLFDHMSDVGINVIITDLKKLRDSNQIYSPFWRLLFSWWGNSDRGGRFPHPFSSTKKKISLRSYLTLLNFKANHRKALLVDSDSTLTAIVSSANPHDASADHCNTALMFSGPFCEEIYRSEESVARFSGGRLGSLPQYASAYTSDTTVVRMQLCTEGAIRNVILRRLHQTEHGTVVTAALFYLSDRDIISAFGSAAKRGIKVRLVLDRNTNAFGYRKKGIPNMPVAFELADSGCSVVFYRTEEEQFHTKLLLIDYPGDSVWAMTGSANYTRRNIDDLNLEMTCALAGSKSTAVAESLINYCNMLLSSQTEKNLIAPLSAFTRPTELEYLKYRFMEASGLSNF